MPHMLSQAVMEHGPAEGSPYSNASRSSPSILPCPLLVKTGWWSASLLVE